MATIGTITVNLFSTDKDETVYATSAHNLSHVDNVTLRRTLPKTPTQPLRTNIRFERGFPVGTDGVEKSVTLNVSTVASAGVNPEDMKDYIEECLTQVAETAGAVGTTGDIHLGS